MATPSAVSQITTSESLTPIMQGTILVKKGLTEMLKGGVIMDVMTVEQARIAEAAGACAVMALEKIPADIRMDGGVARMSDPALIKCIKSSVSIPVMAKCRIGHFVEAQILQECEIDCIDESEVLTIADEELHINKSDFTIPFVCGCRNLGEALRRINEGASMIRSKGEAGTGNIVHAVKHIRSVSNQIAKLKSVYDNKNMQEEEKDRIFHEFAFQEKIPVELVKVTCQLGRLPVVNFAAGGIATPADAALCMQLGVDGVFVGSGIFKSKNPAERARAIVMAVTHFNNPSTLLAWSENLGPGMVGISNEKLQIKWGDKEAKKMY